MSQEVNSNTLSDRRLSSRYGAAQTTLLCLYALAAFLDREHVLFAPGWSGVVGNVLCAVGVLIMFSALATIRDTVQINPEPKAGGQLTTTGIYRFLRHPIYTAIILMVVGLFLKKPTILMAVAGASIVIFLLLKVRFEEKLLRATYPGYAEYQRRVCGVLPGW